MRVTKHLVVTFACLSLAACGIDMSETKDTRSAPEKAVKATGQGGSLELRAPDKRPDDKGELLQVTIRRSCAVWDEPVQVEDDDEQIADASDSSESGYGLQEGSSDDAGPDQEEEEGYDGSYDPPVDMGCNNYFYFEETQHIELGSNKKISFKKLVEGLYDIEVMILDADGQVIEQGFSSAHVVDGETSRATVELYKTVGDGRLKIDIIRAGDGQVGFAETK